LSSELSVADVSKQRR